MIWIFNEGEGDGIEFKLPFKIFSTFIIIIYRGQKRLLKCKHRCTNKAKREAIEERVVSQVIKVICVCVNKDQVIISEE